MKGKMAVNQTKNKACAHHVGENNPYVAQSERSRRFAFVKGKMVMNRTKNKACSSRG